MVLANRNSRCLSGLRAALGDSHRRKNRKHGAIATQPEDKVDAKVLFYTFDGPFLSLLTDIGRVRTF